MLPSSLPLQEGGESLHRRVFTIFCCCNNVVIQKLRLLICLCGCPFQTWTGGPNVLKIWQTCPACLLAVTALRERRKNKMKGRKRLLKGLYFLSSSHAFIFLCLMPSRFQNIEAGFGMMTFYVTYVFNAMGQCVCIMSQKLCPCGVQNTNKLTQGNCNVPTFHPNKLKKGKCNVWYCFGVNVG